MGETPLGFVMPKTNVSEPKLSASAVISRSINNHNEILLGHRVSEMPSFPDFWSFPGGGISKVDIKFGENHPNFLATMGEDRIAAIALLRELVEEVGFTPNKDGKMIKIDHKIRESICKEKENWAKNIENEEILITKFDAEVISERVTPPFAPIRFKNKFFHVEISNVELEPTFPPGRSEFDEFRWWNPILLLNSWKMNEIRLPPPIVTLIKDLVNEIENTNNIKFACKILSKKRPSGYHRIEFSPDVECLPLRTKTLPPATHTNCYILGEEGGDRVIVDPAAKTNDSLIDLASKIKEVTDSGSKIIATIYTHRHPDHIGDLSKISKIYQAPIWISEETKKIIPNGMETSVISEGDDFTLNGPSGKTSWSVIETSGHCPGHICIIGESGIVSGDNCVGVGSILVPSGEGNMGKYIEGLERLKKMKPKMLFPGHGPLVANPDKLLSKYIEHRKNRHNKIFDIVRSGQNNLNKISQLVYLNERGVNLTLAEDQVLAHLKLLIEEEKIKEVDRQYYLY